jgi:SAM-dependent methyltransferase
MPHSLIRGALRFRPVAIAAASLRDTVDRLRGARRALVPPRRMIFVGAGDFLAIGEEFKQHFVTLGGLRPEHDVLDVGCGIGRMAVPLVGWLEGNYEGFDINAKGIRWCQRHITPSNPSFRFQVANLHNRKYNPRGRATASDYRFPYKTGSFDFVFATSVFTHLLPEDTENYIREIGRVLRSGGRCLVTFFLLDETSSALVEQGRAALSFPVEGNGYRTSDSEVPEARVAYPGEAVTTAFERAGLRPAVHPGSWSGRGNGLSFQDVVVASKEASS